MMEKNSNTDLTTAFDARAAWRKLLPEYPEAMYRSMLLAFLEKGAQLRHRRGSRDVGREWPLERADLDNLDKPLPKNEVSGQYRENGRFYTFTVDLTGKELHRGYVQLSYGDQYDFIPLHVALETLGARPETPPQKPIDPTPFK